MKRARSHQQEAREAGYRTEGSLNGLLRPPFFSSNGGRSKPSVPSSRILGRKRVRDRVVTYHEQPVDERNVVHAAKRTRLRSVPEHVQHHLLQAEEQAAAFRTTFFVGGRNLPKGRIPGCAFAVERPLK